MVHSLNNHKSREALVSKLRDALQSAESICGMLITWERNFDRFASEAGKSLSKWVTQADIIAIIVKSVQEHVRFADSNYQERQKIREFASADQIDRVASVVVNLLSELPQTYDIAIPLPRIKLEEPLFLFEGAEISASEPECQAGLLAPYVQSRSVLKVSACGYASSSRRESAMREAISKFKVIFSVGHLFGAFNKNIPHELTAISLFSQRNDALQYAIVQKNTGKTSIPLAMTLSQYLNDVVIPDSVRLSSYSNSPLEVTKKALSVLYSTEAEANVQSIRRALEWGFDAEIEEDETTQFVKRCIGLEALLTDQQDGVGITEQLADRCAYILDRTSSARDGTRAEIRAIYRLRSKIVHGAVVGLSPDDLLVARASSRYLNAVLRVELQGVIDWWNGRSKEVPR